MIVDSTREEDDLEVTTVPGVLRKHCFEIAFGALDRRAVGQPPAVGESVDVGVDGNDGTPNDWATTLAVL